MQYVSIIQRSNDGEHKSALGLNYCNSDIQALGVIPHCNFFKPETIADSMQLIGFLKEMHGEKAALPLSNFQWDVINDLLRSLEREVQYHNGLLAQLQMDAQYADMGTRDRDRLKTELNDLRTKEAQIKAIEQLIKLAMRQL